MNIEKDMVYIQDPNFAFIAALDAQAIKDLIQAYQSGLRTLTETILCFNDMGLHVQSMKPIRDIESADTTTHQSGTCLDFVRIQEEKHIGDGQTFGYDPHLRIEFTIRYYQSVSSTETLTEVHMTKLNFLFIMYGMCTEIDVIDPKNPGAVGPGSRIRSKLLDAGFKIPEKLSQVE